MTFLAVDGYDLLGMVTRHGDGEMWLALHRDSGDLVTVRRSPALRDPVTRGRLSRLAAELSAIDHPHVVRLREIAEGPDEAVMVFDHAAGRSLAELIDARGRLSPGEVVTLVVPLGQALDALWEHGIVHGGITAEQILVNGLGQPLLTDVGIRHILEHHGDGPPGTGRDAGNGAAVHRSGRQRGASDVSALAAVCLAALAESSPGADSCGDAARAGLVCALRAALSGEEGDGSAGRRLAAAAFEACPPTPIVSTSSGPPHARPARPAEAVDPRAGGQRPAAPRTAARSLPRPPPRHRAVPSRPRFGRLLVAASLVAPVVVLAALLGAAWAVSGKGRAAGGPEVAATRIGKQLTPGVRVATRTAVPVPSDSLGPSPRWEDVLHRLDSVRSAAFAHSDVGALEQVYVPGSPALRRDRRMLAEVVSAGATTRGLTFDIRSVRVRTATSDRAVLHVVDVLRPYQVVVDHGTSSVRRPGRPAARWRVTLLRGERGWRIYDVVRA